MNLFHGNAHTDNTAFSRICVGFCHPLSLSWCGTMHKGWWCWGKDPTSYCYHRDRSEEKNSSFSSHLSLNLIRTAAEGTSWKHLVSWPQDVFSMREAWEDQRKIFPVGEASVLTWDATRGPGGDVQQVAVGRRTQHGPRNEGRLGLMQSHSNTLLRSWAKYCCDNTETHFAW